VEDLELAASAIKQGRLIAYPTESVFGLGCDPLCKTAVQKIIAIKGRDAGKG
jgi:L-threonylcarbamoyladenylate synthase